MADAKEEAARRDEAKRDGRGTRKVRIVRPFTITRQDGTRAEYLPGEHDMPADDADHPFTAHFSDNPPDYEPPYGTVEYDMRNQSKYLIAQRDAESFAEEQRQKNADEFAKAQEAEAQRVGSGDLDPNDPKRSDGAATTRRQQNADMADPNLRRDKTRT